MSSERKKSPITVALRPEELAYWYLRLNGFFTIPNFVVHPDSGSNQKTDIDLLAARFPFRGELPNMRDEEFFESYPSKTLVVLAEVKTSECEINRTWLTPEKGTLEIVIGAAGWFPPHEVPLVAKSLRESGRYCSQLYHIGFLAIGSKRNEHLKVKYPEMQQIMWTDVLPFIHKRFRAFHRQKRAHPQWDGIGQRLWELSMRNKDVQTFIDAVRIEENLA